MIAMSSDRTQIRELLAQASELPSDQRDVFLTRACGRDAAMRREVENLLNVLEQAGQFLAPTAADRPCPTTGLLDTPDDAARTLAPESHDAGARINHYRIVQLIGEGGFGRVYLAEQETPVKRQVALKIIKPGMDTRQVIKRFKAERQALAMMDHPNIARVLDAGSTEAGRPYFVMELVRGMPITEYGDAVSLSPRAAGIVREGLLRRPACPPERCDSPRPQAEQCSGHDGGWHAGTEGDRLRRRQGDQPVGRG
jgi:hypothetical protein